MPGVIPHLLAGCAMFGLGLVIFRRYFRGKTREKVYLLLVCLLFSIIPDFFLALYFFFHVSSRQALLPYHNLLHYLFTPVALVVLVLLLVVDVKHKPIWILGCLSLLLHIGMDLIIHEGGVWI